MIKSDNKICTGLAIVFEKRSDYLGFFEIIHKGAITLELINNSDIFARFDHYPDYVLARSKNGKGTLELNLQDDGLYYRFSIPDTAKGNEFYTYLMRGELDKSSFAFSISNDKGSEYWEKLENGDVLRHIYKIDALYDISGVMTPAYPDTYCYLENNDEENNDEENNDNIRNNMKTINNNLNKELQSILDKAQSEKRSLNQEEIDRMNQIIEERSANNTEEKEEKEKENKEEDSPKEKDETTETENSDDDEKDDSESLSDSDNFGDSDDDENRDCKKDEERSVKVKTEEINNRNTKTNIINNKMEFSLLKAINNVVNNRALDVVEAAANEKGLAEMRKSGLNYSGQILLPVEELRAVAVADTHDETVQVDLWDVLGPLRAKNILAQAGARFLTGLVGDITLPKMSAGNCYWASENGEAQESEYTFSSVKMSPKRLTCFVDISKQFIAQDSVSAEALIRQDIVKSLNAKLETTILGNLAGTTTQPAGLFAGADLETIAGYEDICNLEADIEDENVFGEMKYIMSNKAKAALRCMAKSEHNQYVLENNTVDGTPFLNTSNIKGKNIAYGDFSNLYIGQWGSVDIIVDPYTQATKGMIRLVINAYFDSVVVRPEAFKFGVVE